MVSKHIPKTAPTILFVLLEVTLWYDIVGLPSKTLNIYISYLVGFFLVPFLIFNSCPNQESVYQHLSQCNCLLFEALILDQMNQNQDYFIICCPFSCIYFSDKFYSLLKSLHNLYIKYQLKACPCSWGGYIDQSCHRVLAHGEEG